MQALTAQDHALIAAARAAIIRNYDHIHFNFTVGAAVRCADGEVWPSVDRREKRSSRPVATAARFSVTTLQTAR